MLADVGPLPIQFINRAYVEAQLDKLLGNEEYTEILLLDETPPADKEGDKEHEPEPAQAKGGPTKRTRSRTVKSVKRRKGNGDKPKAHEHLRGLGEVQAAAYNLNDLKEVVELSQYLKGNGGWELFTTPKNGQCLWASVLCGVDAPEEYQENHMRNQFILWCITYHEFTFRRLYANILAEYGHSRISREEYLERQNSKENPLTDDEIAKYQKPGPFSFISYLRYMLNSSAWGDNGTVSLLSMMWNMTITVVEPSPFAPEEGEPHSFVQLKMRHNRDLNAVDLVIVFVGDNHFLGTCKYHFSFVHVFSVRITNTVRRQLSMCGGRSSCAATASLVRRQLFVVRASGHWGPQVTILPDVRRQSCWCGYRLCSAATGPFVRRQLLRSLLH